MKKSTFLLMVCFILAGFLPELTRAQQQAPVTFAVFEEKVSTADMPAFNKVQQETVDLWNKHKLGLSVSCYSTDDNSYFWVMPTKSFASIDTIFEKSAAFMKLAKEQDGFDGSGFRDLSTSSFSFLFWRPDLSYHAAGYHMPSAENPYVEWSFCYMRQGHEAEAAAAIQKYVDFYKKNGIDYSWDFFEVALGQDVPLWIGMNVGTDPLSMRQIDKTMDEKYNVENKEMWVEFAKHIRHIDIKTGWFKPAWSVK